jgi:hypothetical protein
LTHSLSHFDSLTETLLAEGACHWVSEPRERVSEATIGGNYEADLLHCPASRMKKHMRNWPRRSENRYMDPPAPPKLKLKRQKRELLCPQNFFAGDLLRAAQLSSASSSHTLIGAAATVTSVDCFWNFEPDAKALQVARDGSICGATIKLAKIGGRRRQLGVLRHAALGTISVTRHVFSPRRVQEIRTEPI